MKTKITLCKFINRVSGLFLMLLLMVFSARAQNTNSVTLTNCSSTANTLEFDIMVTNTGTSTTMISQSGAYGFDWNAAGCLNGGTASLAYLPGTSQFSATQSAFTTTNSFIENNVPSSNPTRSIRINAIIATTPGNGTPLPPGLPVRVGRFRITNTVNWTPNSSPNFVFVLANTTGKTTTRLTNYINGATAGAVATITTSVNSTCILNLNAPTCTAPTLSAVVTNVSCAGNNDGAINLTVTGGSPSPFTYVWSNGATSEDISNVLPGTYFVTVTTNTGGCTAAASYTVGGGALNVVYYADADGDGFGNAAITVLSCTGSPAGFVANSTDCNDNNASINPNAAEVCNGLDDDCDGTADDGLIFQTYYVDADGDGFGAATATGVSSCAAIAGSVTNNSDCADNNAAINPAAAEVCDGLDNDCDGSVDEGLTFLTYYVDGDGDGYGAGAGTSSCAPIAGSVTVDGDCNDNNAAINPGATEVCNGVDDDCDGSVDEGVLNTYYADGDGDGFGAGAAILACTQPANSSLNNLDCNDNNSAINPNAAEVCNGLDDDCDGAADDGLIFQTYYVDADGDGFGAGAGTSSCAPIAGSVTNNSDCADNNAAINPNAAEVCNGLDDDCDGTADDGLVFQTYYVDADGDSYGSSSATGVSSCAAIAGSVTNNADCNDGNAAINPAAAEVCDGVDNDCDGSVDEGVLSTFFADADNDGFGNAAITAQACTAPAGFVAVAGDCNDNNIAINPNAAEVCNGIDDNCDGSVDNGLTFLTYYVDGDGDGFGAGAGTSSCAPIAGSVTVDGDCNDNNSAINPNAAEVCNGIDDNCDGSVDNGLTFLTYYVDGDGDGFGAGAGTSSCAPIAGSVTNNGDCNDNNPAINPNAAEVCNNIDDNCNGSIDDGLVFVTYYADADGDTYGNAAVTQSSCSGAPAGYVANSADCNDNAASVNPAASEVCNGIDDNCDGLADNGLTFLTYYVDGDGDGFGAGAGTSSCAAIAGSVTVDGDCNDNNSAINPNATEVCDGVDNDCDGSIDEGLVFLTYYVDGDGDGFGAGNGTSSCVAIAGSVTVDGDCNDNNSAINPNAAEVCNGIDDNCDGSVDNGLTFLTYYVDGDGDGFGAGNGTSSCVAIAGSVTNNGDCNDNNSAINPNAAEVCNGIDDNCDGSVDEGLTFVTYYADADGDMYGNANMTQSTCNGAPAGYVAMSGDCNDNNAAINPAAAELCNGIDDNCDGSVDNGLTFLTYYVDGDGDGFGAGAGTSSCAPIAGSVTVDGDCNDNNSAINPNATEVCDGVDNDCDGSIDEGLTFLTYYVDADGDGFGSSSANGVSSCSPIFGSVTNNGDCNDNSNSIFPGAPEQCNGIDDDCDGSIDEGVVVSTWYIDADGDGFGNAAISVTNCAQPSGYVLNNSDCNDNNAAINPSAAEVCDGIDNDCDNNIDEGVLLTFYADADNDGYGSGSNTVQACSAPAGYINVNGDCNDNNAAVNPGAAEVCDGLDNDCDGSVDEGVLLTFYADADGDGFGNITVTTLGCSAPAGYVANDGDCNDNNAAINPAAAEVCDGLDNDCDGTADDGLVFLTYYVDGDGDGFGAGAGTSSCAAIAGSVTVDGDCNDNNSAINPGAAEVCNGIDDDCDGTADDGLVFLTYYVDGDGDGFGAGAGTSSCVAIAGSVTVDGDCNDNNAAINPGAAEVCNGIDEDCDGTADDGLTFVTYFADADGDMYGNSAMSQSTCNGAPAGYVLMGGDCNDNNAAINPAAAEICDGVDNDCDGSIDEGLDTFIYYADVDGDTYGNAGNSLVTCAASAPAGYVTNALDCNDGNAAVNPAATEVCNNGIDDNCNGSVDEGCGCVNPPTANAGSAQTICSGQNATLSGSIGGGATNGTWSTAGDGTFTPSASVLNATYVPGPGDIAAGSVVLTLTTDADPLCTPAVSTVTISIQTPPAVPGAISGQALLCNPNNVNVTYSIAPVAGAASYTWTVPAGTNIVSGQGTNSITVNWSFANIHNGVKGNICVTANNSNSCGSSSSSCLFISVQLVAPVTPASISGPAKVCPGETATYSVALVNRGDVYNWTVPAGATIVSGAGTNVISVQYGAGFTGGQVTVAAVNGCGSSPARVRNVSLNILPAPASISGQSTGICGASSVSYTAASVVGATSYLWSVPAGATIASGQGTASISVNFGGSFTSGALSVIAQNACGNGTARTITVTGAPGIPAVISGPTVLCANQTYLYSIPTITGASAYFWTVPTGFTVVAGQGTKDATIKAAANPNTNLTISVRGSNACGTGPIRSLNGVSITLCPRVGEAGTMNVVAYPNPVSDLLNIGFDSDKNQDVLVIMSDAAGRVVLSENRNADEGANKFEVSVKGMASGIYTLNLRTADSVQQVRIIVE